MGVDMIYNNDVDDSLIRISISGFRRSIIVGRGVVKALGDPNYVGLRVNKKLDSMLLFAAEPSDPMSFQVPRDFGIRDGCIFRIISKDFVRSITLHNGLDNNKNYTIPGKYMRNNNAIVFNIEGAQDTSRSIYHGQSDT